MSVEPHQLGYYNYHPGDRVWYFDTQLSAFKEGSCYQVEIKIYKKPTAPLERKLTYLVALDDSPTTLRVKESDLYKANADGSLSQAPTAPEQNFYHVAYNFDPDEAAWVIDRANRGVKYGTVYQTEIKVHRDAATPSHAKITYYISFNDTNGTTIAKEEDVFSSVNAAWAALGIVIGPTPTPTVPIDPENPPPGSGNQTLVSKKNGESFTLHAGQPVYLDQASGTIKLVKYDNTSLTFLGFVSDDSIPPDGNGLIITEGAINTIEANWNNVIVGGGALLAGERYYLSSEKGKLTNVPPTVPESASPGDVVRSKQVGMALTTTELDIRLGPNIKLFG